MTGTPRYMAPEAYRDEKCTEKVDIYSLAMMMWEMTTGEVRPLGSTVPVSFV
jgi:serine/threonine protein kinase